MSTKPLYSFDEDLRRIIIRMHLVQKFGGDITGPTEGKTGEVYSVLLPENHFARRLAAKCPRFKAFGTPERARSGVENLLHEIEKSHSIHSNPWVNRFFDIQFIHGWPFIWSRYRNGTMADLIANPLVWTVQDRISSLIMICRALFLAQCAGISAHQYLKPENIFFDDLRRNYSKLDPSGVKFWVYVGDFGLADAFRDFGTNSGSRPYMAPEQYTDQPIEPSAKVAIDVFALGVLIFECFSDGMHPVGVRTSDVWPWRKGMVNKWKEARPWRTWAINAAQTLPEEAPGIAADLMKLIRDMVAAKPDNRPSIEHVEGRLWEVLAGIDVHFRDHLRLLINWSEAQATPNEAWPHMDDKMDSLRKFYSQV